MVFVNSALFSGIQAPWPLASENLLTCLEIPVSCSLETKNGHIKQPFRYLVLCHTWRQQKGDKSLCLWQRTKRDSSTLLRETHSTTNQHMLFFAPPRKKYPSQKKKSLLQGEEKSVRD